MHKRVIWTRGLTPNDIGKRISVDGLQGVLRGVEHFDRGSVLIMQMEIDMPHDAEVTLQE